MMMDTALYDINKTRYRLVASNPNTKNLNWLFLPCGPGADSVYYRDLIALLNLPGNVWLIDLPANGDNFPEGVDADYNFEHWSSCLLTAVKMFENPVLVGQSFGGMFPLLFPELEQLLAGHVIICSSPTLWFEQSAACAAKHNLPALDAPLAEFEQEPNAQTFRQLFVACAPYYFPGATLDVGRKLLQELPYNYHATTWWLEYCNRTQFTAKWIPSSVQSLIIGASHDYITPFSLFKDDQRFQRDNITLVEIDGAGHFPWFEQPAAVKAAFTDYIGLLLEFGKF